MQKTQLRRTRFGDTGLEITADLELRDDDVAEIEGKS
jgi:hypothetical protein